MFTGIIREMGSIKGIQATPTGKRLEIATKKIRPNLGASVAVNGVCLTASKLTKEGFCADVIRESLKLTTLGALGIGDKVNLEPSLTAGDELGGHIVSGHVDATGVVKQVKKSPKETRMTITLPSSIKVLVAKKGSITINGVSLTVTDVKAGAFEVALIPYTLEETTFGALAKGDRVNLEADVLARYVARMLKRR